MLATTAKLIDEHEVIRKALALSGQSPSLPYIYPRCCMFCNESRNITWVWVNTYRYIFSGMNIHLPAILGFTRYQGFDPSPHLKQSHSCLWGIYMYLCSEMMNPSMLWTACSKNVQPAECQSRYFDAEGAKMRNETSGWWFGTFFYFPFHIWVVILPIDELIFFKRGRSTTNQHIVSWPFLGPLRDLWFQLSSFGPSRVHH